MILLFWAVVLFFYQPNDLRASLPTIFMAVSLVLTVLLYGSPGVSFNHLVDISAASVLYVGYVGFSARSMIIRPSANIFVTLMVFIIMKNLPMIKEGIADYKLGRSKYPEQLTNFVREQNGILLSEDPLLPVFTNKKPYLLDPFMFRLVMLNDSTIRTMVVNSVINKKYSAIVFSEDPLKNKDWYYDFVFGETFMINVLEHYHESGRVRGYVIYQPR